MSDPNVRFPFMEIFHLTAGARGSEPLADGAGESFALLRRAARALGSVLLAYCLMRTHLHVVTAGAESASLLAGVLTAFTRIVNLRRGRRGALLRGPVDVRRVPDDPEEIARAIAYDHANPVKAGIVERAIDYEWSSQREFAGLSRAGLADIAGANAAVGPMLARRLAGFRPALADLAPAPRPEPAPELLLAAVAQMYGFAPAELVLDRRSERLSLARAVYVQLGVLEGYKHEQLGPAFGRPRVRVTQLGALAVPASDVQIARTLIREPGLRRRLEIACGRTPRLVEPVGYN